MSHLEFLELCYIGGAVLLVSNLWFFVRVLRPLRKLSAQAEMLSKGEFDSFDRECGGIPEIGELQRVMSGMVGHVRRAQEQNRAYATKLAEGQESERKRIARELHDDTIQPLIAISQSIDIAKGWLKTDPERAGEMLSVAREQAVITVTSLRNLIGGLRPPALEELGLIPALEMQLHTFSDIHTSLKVTGEIRRLDEIHELVLFRVGQEALHNAIRHSKARHVQISVTYQLDGVKLRIEDDGLGFCPPSDMVELSCDNHYGLLGIQERIANLDGWFIIDSSPQNGTTLEVFVPTVITNQPDHLVRDPVCSALIEPQGAFGSLQHNTHTYYFCCPVCQGAFKKDPDLYLSQVPQGEIADARS